MFKQVFLTVFFYILLLPINSFGENVVDYRKDKFQENKNLMKEIYTSLKNEEFKKIVLYTRQIYNWSKEMEKYFPEGSLSRSASEEIWSNFDDFKLYINKNSIASENLINSSLNKDLDQSKHFFSELSQSCKSCHRKFKN